MYSCKTLADSIGPNKVRLTTLECTYPRFVHAELMTHRVFSRNSASSRAIPIQKMIEAVDESPVIPVYWGKNQKGMQATQELEGIERELAIQHWLHAKDEAVANAREMLALGAHKQIVNRILEPWMWITVIITATEWDNFFGLRRHPDAQPEIRHLADLMHQSMAASKPAELEVGDWHLPLVGIDVPDMESCLSLSEAFPDPKLALAKISAGRCARVSYLTHDGVRDPTADIGLYNRLAKSGHMSPMEHPAECLPYHFGEPNRGGIAQLSRGTFYGNIRGWKPLRKHIPGEAVFSDSITREV